SMLNDLLEAERNQLRALIDHLPLGILITYAPSGETGIINRKGIELLGASVVNSTGKIDFTQTYNLFRPDGSPYPPQALPFHHTLATGQAAQAEDVILRHPDGRETLLWVQSVPLRDKAGSVVGALSIYQDVTLLKEAEKARAMLRSQRQFLSTISHELRTPLHSILSLSQLLLQGDATWHPDQRQCLQVLHRSGEHLLRLIDELMNLIRIETGKEELYLSTFSLADTVHWALASLRPHAAQKGLTITCDLPPDLPLLRSDERKVSQILFNLVHNAIKFTEQGSIHITARVREGMLEVAVKDTGIGIPPQQIPLVFERFRQLDEGLARKYGGIGLGLTICKNLVDLLGGSLWCESAVGIGSTFYFTIPIQTKEEETHG
ncbi:MAG: ATP-binding protein, partial [Abditibacteriales bacterium]|nr:ATP-binding protein [Abditibacteriales bacterium]MDW8367969.1 ATP-binding protein [Abditibacteriales bacterium]